MSRGDDRYSALENAFWKTADRLLGLCPAYCDQGFVEVYDADGAFAGYEICKRCGGTGKRED